MRLLTTTIASLVLILSSFQTLAQDGQLKITLVEGGPIIDGPIQVRTSQTVLLEGSTTDRSQVWVLIRPHAAQSYWVQGSSSPSESNGTLSWELTGFLGEPCFHFERFSAVAVQRPNIVLQRGQTLRNVPLSALRSNSVVIDKIRPSNC